MIINATLTAWTQRTGTDKAGEPVWTARPLVRPVGGTRGDLTRREVEQLAARGVTGECSFAYAMAGRFAPDIARGDKVTVDGTVYRVLDDTTGKAGSLYVRKLMLAAER